MALKNPLSNLRDTETSVRDYLYNSTEFQKPVAVIPTDTYDEGVIRLGKENSCFICNDTYKRNGVMYYIIAINGQSFYTCNTIHCKEKMKEKLNGK